MTLALCPCGNYSTPLVVQESVTLSGDVCNENNQYRFKMAQTCSLLLYIHSVLP